MSINLSKILRDLSNKQAAADSRLLPKPGTVREPSATERDTKYLPINYGLLFCCHSKSYFDTCGSCKRDRRLAHDHYTAFLKRHGLA